ncbi:acyl-CoA dehydrogenase family protein [Pseudomonas sp. NFACC13-1]|uniref:acyl-CoA dehydrogenase family protein n=1 Tax=Pseudomonas sp. NFACC13-1 TaxID=1566245 RepID=UPI0008881583|nr:acyl-CoA dehydrogenase family protein [Pseudomonas sp. NFACC13-1]SDB35236.1 Acyl-CoA dehydrogenase [Pseudomonas sp. NFACC13-1]
MNIAWTAQDNAFRQEVIQFFERELTDELRNAGRFMTSVYGDHELCLRWQRKLLAQGWLAPSWPVESGGCDWSVAQHYIFAQEKAYAGAPPVSPMGIQMCAPALIAFGTAEQKTFFLPRMLSGEHFWCQGYSEPGAGSDLAALNMTAVDEGDTFVCNGSKLWSTHAHVANWVFCLVRTSREDRPQKGITFLLIEMGSPGIDVRPIVSLTGEHIQNEIIFTDVRVPKTNAVGKIGAGWTVAKYLLEFERGGAAYAPLMHVRLRELRQLALQAPSDQGGCLADDPLFMSRLADVECQVNALELYELETLSRLTRGESPGASASVLKILGTELQQAVTELGLDAAGHYSTAFQPQAGHPGGPVLRAHRSDAFSGGRAAALAPLRYFNERAGTIYAGSNEIQRNILAKTVLGL